MNNELTNAIHKALEGVHIEDGSITAYNIVVKDLESALTKLITPVNKTPQTYEEYWEAGYNSPMLLKGSTEEFYYTQGVEARHGVLYAAYKYPELAKAKIAGQHVKFDGTNLDKY